MVRSRLLIPFLAATALVAPAVSADEPEWTGITCGVASSSDPTLLVEADRSVQTGNMTCGPWTAFDLLADDLSGPSGEAGAANITITGTIQVNQELYGGAAAAKATCTGTGTGVVSAVCVISFITLSEDSVYLCNHVTMTMPSGTYAFTFDEDDNPANGTQCRLSTRSGCARSEQCLAPGGAQLR